MVNLGMRARLPLCEPRQMSGAEKRATTAYEVDRLRAGSAAARGRLRPARPGSPAHKRLRPARPGFPAHGRLRPTRYGVAAHG
jgi:hypothetical protein